MITEEKVIQQEELHKRRRMLFSYDEAKMKFDSYELADSFSHQFKLEDYTFHEIQDAEGCGFLIHGVGIRVFSLLLITFFTFYF